MSDVSPVPPSTPAAPAAQPALPPEGWFPDVEVPGGQRWWDGSSWTDHRHPPVAIAQPYGPSAVQPYAPAAVQPYGSSSLGGGAAAARGAAPLGSLVRNPVRGRRAAGLEQVRGLRRPGVALGVLVVGAVHRAPQPRRLPVAGGVDRDHGGDRGRRSGPGASGGIAYLGLAVALFIPSLAVAVRRLHDANYSGALYLLVLVPLGSIVVLVFLLMPSNPAGAQYDRPS